MTLVDNHGREITQEELAASYAHDLRVYCDLPPDEVDAKVRERYPGVMRRLDLQREASR